MIARCSPPQTPPPSRSHPRHQPFGALVSAKDGGESGVGAGWTSSSQYGIGKGGTSITPPSTPLPPVPFFFQGRHQGKGGWGRPYKALIFPALSPTSLPKVHVRSWRSMDFLGRAMGERAGTRHKKKNEKTKTPLSNPWGVEPSLLPTPIPLPPRCSSPPRMWGRTVTATTWWEGGGGWE